jgi:hypothetical protein
MWRRAFSHSLGHFDTKVTSGAGLGNLSPRHCERSDLSAEALAKAEAIHLAA